MPLTTIDAGTAKRERPRTPFGAPHVFVLVRVDGERPEDVHRIARRETVVGRGEDVDLLVEDALVSKRHCAIRVDASVCSVVDLDSLNGTTLNDRRLRNGVAQRLRHLDELRVGDTRILFLAGRIRERPTKV
jgi:pSer/pThr/pTyr-binding forkhead associated (FHA) protein